MSSISSYYSNYKNLIKIDSTFFILNIILTQQAQPYRGNDENISPDKTRY